MHQALLIDEILDIILESCAEWGWHDYRWTLCQLSQCCIAWKDPALDRLWARLDGLRPLVGLLPVKAIGTHNHQLPRHDILHTQWSRFASYASRIKHIDIKDCTTDMDVLTSLRSIIFPKLTSVRVSENACTSSFWCMPPSLQRLDMSLCFRSSSDAQVADATCNAAAQYLEEAQRLCLIEDLRFRGRMTERLNQTLASLTTLNVLHLHASKYLTSETLASIANFPSLHTLHIFAEHVDADDLLGSLRSSSSIFPSLENLCIQAKVPFVHALLPLFSVGRLRKLRIEVDCDTTDLALWQDVFERIGTKFSTSLHTLDIVGYRYSEDDDSPDQPAKYGADTPITFYTLRPLAALHRLRHLAINLHLPLNICDDHLTQMIESWPLIENIDFGRLPGYDYTTVAETSSISSAVFLPIARSCPRLHNLILPTNLVASPTTAPTRKEGVALATDIPHPLRRLCLGRITSSKSCVHPLARKLLDVFPLIVEVEATVEDTASNGGLNVIIQDLRSGSISQTT